MVPISYLQTDKRWANMSYATFGEQTTIREAGCGPTCCAMVVSTLADENVTPADACYWSVNHNYKALHQGTYYAFIPAYLKAYGIDCDQLNTSNLYKSTAYDEIHERAKNEVQNGNWIIACMGPGHWTSSGHFVLWFDVKGDYVLIRDPNSTKESRVKAEISLFQSEVKYYWVVKVQDFLAKQEEALEMVQDRPVKLLGTDIIVDGILKDGRNYLSVDIFKKLGFQIGNDKDKAIIDLRDVAVEMKSEEQTFKGFSFNGTNYVGLRSLAEKLGFNVQYDNETKKITIE